MRTLNSNSDRKEDLKSSDRSDTSNLGDDLKTLDSDWKNFDNDLEADAPRKKKKSEDFFDEDEDDYDYNFEKPGNSGMVILESDFAENVILFNSIETRKLFNNNDGLLFERSSAISDENLQYPLIITGINVFTLFGEDEESRIPSWAYI